MHEAQHPCAIPGQNGRPINSTSCTMKAQPCHAPRGDTRRRIEVSGHGACLCQVDLRALAPDHGERLAWCHALALDEVAQHDGRAAPAAGLAVHVRQLALLSMLCAAGTRTRLQSPAAAGHFQKQQAAAEDVD